MKGVSPLIATIIMIGITVAIALAVAWWIVGISTTFSNIEKLEIINAYAECNGGGWTITIFVKNSGTATTRIEHIFVSNPSGETEIENPNYVPSNTLLPGDLVEIAFTLSKNEYKPGTLINVIVISSGGMKYPLMVSLP